MRGLINWKTPIEGEADTTGFYKKDWKSRGTDRYLALVFGRFFMRISYRTSGYYIWVIESTWTRKGSE